MTANSDRGRAPYAADPAASRGRLHDEPGSPERTPFQRDRDRIVHAAAFRRLKDKTQVFLYDENDHYRTRLTHSLEVAQVARSIARALRLDEDLTEAVALAHDLGHPPFGHAGERALNRAMADHGGFDHNAQSLRVVTRLERSYPTFDGLNLTWETLEGIVKHNGPLARADGTPLSRMPLPAAIVAHAAEQDLWLHTYATAEAQTAALSDDIAYNAHDLDDGIRAGLLTLDELAEVELLRDLIAGIDRDYPGLAHPRRVRELIRRLITVMIHDAIAETGRRVAGLRPETADAVRFADRQIVGFSQAMAAAVRAIKSYLFRRLYRSPAVADVMAMAEALVASLFERYWSDPDALPREWRADLHPGEDDRRARRIADFLAGMTDRYAINEYRRLFDRDPDFG